jgi:hypothetical protein
MTLIVLDAMRCDKMRCDAMRLYFRFWVGGLDYRAISRWISDALSRSHFLLATETTGILEQAGVEFELCERARGESPGTRFVYPIFLHTTWGVVG